MNEEWRIIEAFPDYSVSSHGRVKRTTPNRYGLISDRALVPVLGNHGYLVVSLHRDTHQSAKTIHTLVCHAFHGPKPSRKHQAAHFDGNKRNNFSTNLAWKTPSENNMDKNRHGTMRTGSNHHALYMPQCMPRGSTHGNAKLTEQLVKKIRKDKRSQSAIAASIGVTQSLISQVKNRKVWAHV